MTGLTRGPLPAEVYWRRRLALLTGLVMAVLVIAKLIPGGGHEPKATTVAHVTSPSRSSLCRSEFAKSRLRNDRSITTPIRGLSN